jgi:hypothetical protein
MVAHSIPPKRTPLSSSPSAEVTLNTTVNHWVDQTSGTDHCVDLRDVEMTRRLVSLYYKNALTEFEPFLFEADFSVEEIARFKAAVLDYLAKEDFLKDEPHVLPAAITHVLITSDLGDKKLIEVIEAMETGYKSLLPEDMRDGEQSYVRGKLLLIHELITRIVDINR